MDVGRYIVEYRSVVSCSYIYYKTLPGTERTWLMCQYQTLKMT